MTGPAGPADDPSRRTGRRPILAVRGDASAEIPDILAGEEPLGIRAAGPGQAPVDIAITMRTPARTRSSPPASSSPRASSAPGGSPTSAGPPDRRRSRTTRCLSVSPPHSTRPASRPRTCRYRELRHLRQGVDRRRRAPRAAPGAGPVVARSALPGLPDVLRAAQPVFRRTGGLHAAALSVRKAGSSGSRGRGPAQRARQARRREPPRGQAPARRIRRTRLRTRRYEIARKQGRRAPHPRRCLCAHRPRRGRSRAARDDPRRVPPRRRVQHVCGEERVDLAG